MKEKQDIRNVILKKPLKQQGFTEDAIKISENTVEIKIQEEKFV